jgi:hypothetical protein
MSSSARCRPISLMLSVRIPTGARSGRCSLAGVLGKALLAPRTIPLPLPSLPSSAGRAIAALMPLPPLRPRSSPLPGQQLQMQVRLLCDLRAQRVERHSRPSIGINRSAASTPFCKGVTAVCYQTIARICSGDMVDVPQFHTGQDEIGRADVDDISRGLNWSEMGLAALTDGARCQEQLLPRKR